MVFPSVGDSKKLGTQPFPRRANLAARGGVRPRRHLFLVVGTAARLAGPTTACGAPPGSMCIYPRRKRNVVETAPTDCHGLPRWQAGSRDDIATLPGDLPTGDGCAPPHQMPNPEHHQRAYYAADKPRRLEI